MCRQIFKVALASIVPVLTLSAGDDFVSFYGKAGNSSNHMQSEKSINSISAFKELESTLKKLANLGDLKSLLALGALYEQSFNFQDGTSIKPDITEARRHYESAAKKNSSLAFFKLAMQDVSSGNFDSAYIKFKKSATAKTDPSFVPAAVALSSLTMDKYQSDTKKLLDASNILKPIADKADLPTAFFVLANNYNLLGQDAAASKYLTAACKSKNAPKEITTFCYGGGADITDQRGRKVGDTNTSQTCGN